MLRLLYQLNFSSFYIYIYTSEMVQKKAQNLLAEFKLCEFIIVHRSIAIVVFFSFSFVSQFHSVYVINRPVFKWACIFSGFQKIWFFPWFRFGILLFFFCCIFVGGIIIKIEAIFIAFDLFRSYYKQIVYYVYRYLWRNRSWIEQQDRKKRLSINVHASAEQTVPNIFFLYCNPCWVIICMDPPYSSAFNWHTNIIVTEAMQNE